MRRQDSEDAAVVSCACAALAVAMAVFSALCVAVWPPVT